MLKRVLKISERRAVNRVDDDGHARAFGGEPAENSRLAAVGVDDVGFLFAKNLFEFSQRVKVLERMNGRTSSGTIESISGALENCGFQRTFSAGGRAGNQIHFDAGFCAQAEDGGNGVFLGAADNEPGDDVGNFQIVERLNS